MKNKSNNKGKTGGNTGESRQLRLKYEPENDAQVKTEHIFHPHPSTAELGTKIKFENYIEQKHSSDLLANIVKSELVEFRNDVKPANIFGGNDTETVILEKIPKKEAEILGAVDEVVHSSRNPFNSINIIGDPDSDPEFDPFADVACHPGFSQAHLDQDQSDNSDNDSYAHAELIKSAVGANSSSNLPSSAKAILPKTGTASKPGLIIRNILQCQLCLETHGSQSKLKTHIEICVTSHKDRHRFCIPCNKIFYSRQKYIYHALHRHGIAEAKLNRYPIECQFCHYTFAMEESLVAHIASRHNETSKTKEDDSVKNRKQFKCAECPSSFRHYCDYNRHTQCHKNERAFKCPIPNCDGAFNLNYSLKSHLQRVHSQEKPFECPELNCKKTFKSNTELKAHMACHSDSRPFTCSHQSGCQKTFQNKMRLSQHIMRVHRRVGRVKKTRGGPTNAKYVTALPPKTDN